MQSEDGSNVNGELVSKLSPSHQDQLPDGPGQEDSIVKNGTSNGVYETEQDHSDKNSNGNHSRSSPAAGFEPEQHAPILMNNEHHLEQQPLNFELGHDMQANVSVNNFWHGQHQEEPVFQNFQTMNPTQSIPSYGLNNNNSFPPQMPFGSIGQPSYMPGNHAPQFSSPPGMHGMSMMGNMGHMNGPMSNFNYQNSHNQNQRRAITAQHNYGSMGGKPMNPRYPWSNHQHSYPSGNPQANMSPWTMALQQQKAMNRGPPMNMGPGPKNGQSVGNRNPPMNMNNLMVQQKYNKRSSPNTMMGGGMMKPSGYNSGGAVGADGMSNMDPSNTYQVGNCGLLVSLLNPY